METQKLIQFDSLLYTVYSRAPIAKMKQDVLRQLYHFMPCTFCSILDYTDHEDMTATCHDDPICFPETYKIVEDTYIKLEGQDKNRWVSWEPDCKVYRTSDLYPEGISREQSPIYCSCFAPYELHYAAYAILRHQSKGLGCLSLYRSKSANDFSNEEVLILQMLARHLSQRLAMHHPAADTARDALSGDGNPSGSEKKLLDLAMHYHLTARELEILKSLTLQQSMESWAHQLHISENTLKKHLQSLYRKTGVNRLIQLYSLKT